MLSQPRHFWSSCGGCSSPITCAAKIQSAIPKTGATIAGDRGSQPSEVLPVFATTIHPRGEFAMSEVTHDPRRRDFLKSGALAVAGSGLLGAHALAEPAKSADATAPHVATGQ